MIRIILEIIILKIINVGSDILCAKNFISPFLELYFNKNERLMLK